MSEQMSEADKIRNKRLAKLGGLSQTSQPPPPPSDSSPTISPPADSSTKSPTPTPSLPTQDNSSTAVKSVERAPSPPSSLKQASAKSIPQNGPRINIRSSGTSTGLSEKSARSSTPIARPSSTPPETLAEWENRNLGAIFRMTLDQKTAQDTHGHPLQYLSGIRSDLEDEKQPLLLNVSLLDQGIVEAASGLKKATPLDYLLGCWKRITRQFRAFKSSNKAEDPKFAVLKEARRLCMSYCIFAVTIPDMFGGEATETSPLVDHLLVDPEDDRGVCHEFLTEMVSRFPEDEMAEEALVKAVSDLSRRLAKLTLISDYRPYVQALRLLVRFPAFVSAMVQSPSFLKPDIPAALLEIDTLLGPFFQISPLQSDVTTTYFSSMQTRDKGQIANAQTSIRATLTTHQSDLYDIVYAIISVGDVARGRVLDWFAQCLNSNHKRRAIQVDQRSVSSDGFMLNLTTCLDRLSEPFMDATFSKIDRIDVSYLRRNPRLDIKEETKLNADQNASDEFYSQPAEGKSNFISEIFFLTLGAHHYGSGAVNQTLIDLDKKLRNLEKHIQELEADRHKFTSDPARLAMFDLAVKKYKDQIEKGTSYKFAVQGVLLDELNQGRAMQFMRYVSVWLLRLVSSSNSYPKKMITIPLPSEQPPVFKCLPEYFLEDVVTTFKFIMRNMPTIITTTQSEELVTLCITFLRSSEYIKNPYLKSGLVTILFHGIWPVYGRTKGILGDLLNSMPFATSHLLHALMQFYIEVENTGAHTQFYDKFNIRYEIFQIIKCIWTNTIYRDRLAQESSQNVDFFVRFVNLLLNDVTFVLDESLTAFVSIHDTAQFLANAGSAIDPETKKEKEEVLASAQGRAKSYMQLTNETVSMLKLFTEALATSFTMPEIVQRLADMLDYNLDAMVGPKSSQLKVENPAEYHFNPKVLLAELVDVYLNLRTKENFILAVARDGRSYKPTNFEKATRILRKWALKSSDDIQTWIALGEKFKKAKELDDQAEEDLGEIPDEFLDPLMATLMTDPVSLPSSRNTVDRSTIRSILLSDPHDPFNRVPLKIEDVLPNTALKAEIDAFVEGRKRLKLEATAAELAAVVQEDSNDMMDTTPG
ncbi:hypothetical protein MMC25_006948 [Agyrium rufum]|nr:hypothetical protein [Agyrium rufum]